MEKAVCNQCCRAFQLRKENTLNVSEQLKDKHVNRVAYKGKL